MKLKDPQAVAKTVLSIDWRLLSAQKLWLLKMDAPEAEGLLSLLDAIQDAAVSSGLVLEETVFPGVEK